MDKLRHMIRDRGLRHGWIAKQIGVSAPLFSVILNGDKPFPIDKVSALAKALRCPLAEVRAAIAGEPTPPESA